MRTLTPLILLGLATVIPCQAQNPSVYVRTAPDGRGWQVGNSLVEREVIFDAATGLRSVAWKSKVTGTDFLAAARDRRQWGIEFSVDVDGAALPGAAHSTSDFSGLPSASPEQNKFDFVSANTREMERSGELLEVKLKAKWQPVDVSVFYAVYDGHPVIRKWIAITNRGKSTVSLS